GGHHDQGAHGPCGGPPAGPPTAQAGPLRDPTPSPPGTSGARSVFELVARASTWRSQMPAVTADPLTLPRIPPPAPGALDRPVRSVTTTPRGYEGEGFPVRRAFAGVDLRDLDPFVHMDQLGE